MSISPTKQVTTDNLEREESSSDDSSFKIRLGFVASGTRSQEGKFTLERLAAHLSVSGVEGLFEQGSCDPKCRGLLEVNLFVVTMLISLL